METEKSTNKEKDNDEAQLNEDRSLVEEFLEHQNDNNENDDNVDTVANESDEPVQESATGNCNSKFENQM